MKLQHLDKKRKKWILKSTLSLAGGLILFGTTQTTNVNATVDTSSEETTDVSSENSIDWTINDGVLNINSGSFDNTSLKDPIWTDEQKESVKKIVFTGQVTASGNISGLFSGFTNLQEINNLGNLNVQNVTNFSGLFKDDKALVSLELPEGFTPANVADKSTLNFNNMFSNCTSLETLDISNLDMSGTEYTNGFLQGTDSLKKLTLSSNNNLTNSNLSIKNSDTQTKATGWKVTSSDDGTIELGTVKTNNALVNMYDAKSNNGAKTTWEWNIVNKLSFQVKYIAEDTGDEIYITEPITTKYVGDAFQPESLDDLGILYPGYDTSTRTDTVYTLAEDNEGEVFEVKVKKYIPVTIQINISGTDTPIKIELPIMNESVNDINVEDELGKYANKELLPESSISIEGESDEISSYGGTLKEVVENILAALKTDGTVSSDFQGYDITINAVYDPEEETNTGSNSGGNSSSSNDKTTVKTSQKSATFTDKPNVKLYDDYGKLLSDIVLAPSSDWHNDIIMTLKGTKYYRVATNQWVKASDVYVYHDNDSQVHVNTDDFVSLVKADGSKVTDRGLASNTDWMTDRYIYLDGSKYYRVATNEFVSADDVMEYK